MSNVCVLRGSPPNCLNFTDGTCRQCLTGYTLFRGICVETDINCLVREEENGNCVGCSEDYVLVAGRCS